MTDDADSIDALLQKVNHALGDAKCLLADERVEAAMNRPTTTLIRKQPPISSQTFVDSSAQ